MMDPKRDAEDAVRSLMDTIERKKDGVLNNCDLTRMEYALMSAIYQNKGISQDIMRLQMQLNIRQFHECRKTLLNKGFIDFVPELTDKRIKYLKLTNRGKTIISQVREMILNISYEITEEMDQKEAETFVATLRSAKARLEGQAS